MILKIRVVAMCLLFLGTVFAQETEFEKSPSPPVEETILEEDLVPPPPPAPREVEEYPVSQAEVVDFPDVEAEFPGGQEAMSKFIQDNVQYPEEDREKGVQGRVYVSFIVEKDGSLSTVDLMRGGVSPTINREAKRLIRSMPKWIPAEVKGAKVRARCRLPITFILSSDEDQEEGSKEK